MSALAIESEPPTGSSTFGSAWLDANIRRFSVFGLKSSENQLYNPTRCRLKNFLVNESLRGTRDHHHARNRGRFSIGSTRLYVT